MARIHVTDVSEVLSALPELQPFAADRRLHADLFVCANGFEPRALTLPEALAASGSRCGQTAYFSYSTNIPDNEAMRPRLMGALQTIGNGQPPTEIEEARSGSVLRGLLKDLERPADGSLPRVYVDISAASNRLVMIVVKAVLECPFDLDFSVLYSEAGLYHPTKEEHEANKREWTVDRFGGLEWGVGDVVVASDEFPGYHIDQLPDFVMIIAGYNRDRARAVISHADPSLLPRPADASEQTSPSEPEHLDEPLPMVGLQHHVAWLLGAPHLPEDAWRREAQREIHDIDARALEMTISTFDYRDTIRVLEDLYEPRCGLQRFSLSPMGSKMQSVGAALFCHLRPDVRVLFAKPQEYNAAQYSEDCKGTWILEFGSVQGMRSAIERLDLVTLHD